MRNVAKILSIVSSRCESTSACSLCADFSSNVASVDAIPCILVSALQTYHRLTVDVTHFLASTNPRLSRNSTFCNLQDIDTEDEERPLPTTVSSILFFLHFLDFKLKIRPVIQTFVILIHISHYFSLLNLLNNIN